MLAQQHTKTRRLWNDFQMQDTIRSVVRAWTSGARSFSALAEKCEGLWPVELSKVIQHIGLPLKMDISCSILSEYPDWPEPHPALYEWRFSRECAKEIAQLAIELSGSIVCIGCPTVFHFLNLAGVSNALVDANPIVLSHLRKLWPASEIYCLDLANPIPEVLHKRFDVIVGDPPWYLDHFLIWAQRACELASGPSAKLLISMLPKLTRPNAKTEISYLIGRFSELGSTKVLEAKAIYETPRFEIEAIATWGQPAPRFWRRGHWLEVKLNNQLPIMARKPPLLGWKFHQFGSEIVAVRESITPGKPRILPLGSGILRSSSLRDPIRPRIDIWTSRNRVFEANGGEYILDLFNRAALAFNDGARVPAADLGTTMFLYGIAGLEEICQQR